MQRKEILMFTAVAILVGSIVSMTTSGVVAAQTPTDPSNSNNFNTNDCQEIGLPGTNADSATAAPSDSETGATGDADEPGDVDVGEEEDTDTGNEDAGEATDDEETGATGDADEPGDVDVGEEEDTDTGNEDAGEATDDEESSTASTSANGNAAGANDQVASDPCNIVNEILGNPHFTPGTTFVAFRQAVGVLYSSI